MDIKTKLLTLSIIIALFSCDKEEFLETTTITIIDHTKYGNDTIIESVPYKEDSIINQVGCYYPMYEPGYKGRE